MVTSRYDIRGGRAASAVIVRALGAIAAGLMIVTSAACGSAGGSTASASEGASGTTINVAVAANSKPLSYTESDGSLSGYEVAVLKAVDKQLKNYSFNIEAVADDAEEIGLDSGKYGLITGGYFKTESREKKYLFPDVNTGVSLMKIYTLKDDSSVKSLDDLHGKKIAPISPSGGVNNLLVHYNEKHDGNRSIDIVRQDNISLAENFKGLVDGKYDAVVEPEQSFDLKSIENSLGDKFRATKPVQVNNQYFVVSKSQKTFLADLNKALKTLKDNGTLEQLSKQYFGENVFQYKETAA